MSKIYILILALSAVVLCHASQSFEEDIAQLNSTSFGQTILETIQMELDSENSVQNLVEMLQRLDAQLDAEQTREDQTHDRFNTNCKKDQSALKDVISQCEIRTQILKTQVDKLNPQKAQKVSDLTKKNIDLVDLQGELDRQQESRQQEKTIYLNTLDDLEKSLFAINAVKKLYNDFLDVLLKGQKSFGKGDSFLQQNDFEIDSDRDDQYYFPSQENIYAQISQDDITQQLQNEDMFDDDSVVTSLAQVSHQINKLKHNIKDEGIKTMLQGLAQLSSLVTAQNPSQEQEALSRKVLVIINQMTNFVQKSRASEEQAEDQRQKAFTQLEQMYGDQIILTQSSQVAIQGAIELMNNELTGASNEKFELDSKIEVKSNQMNDREKECRDEKSEYSTSESKRDEERQSLAEALDLITTKLGSLKNQVTQVGQ